MLDWNRFETLPGDPTTNFELLCRGVVRRHYGHLGVLQELKNQPGVEFHLTLDRDHPSLGMRGEKIGWQCKWFKYKTDGTLSANAKHQIQHSLEKTREHVEGVDHWFLWTHRTLSKQDATWFKGLEKSYSFKLHCWNELDLEQLLSGPALDLRNSYFGELALTNYMLREQHEKSVAPIAGRWLHDVHQVMDEEMNIRQALGQPVAWEEFKKAKGQLAWSINQLSSALEEGDYEEWRGKLQTFKALCDRAEQYCEIFEGAINGNSLETIRSFRLELAEYSKDEIYDVLRQLRRRNLPLSLVITNSVKYLDDVYLLLSDALDKLSVQQLAIIADAGGGKTQMAAELTAPTSDRPAGILILGRQLKAGQSLDSIAKNLTFYQQPVPSFEALLGALDAAAERASCRLPIVIDGLNEAEDPREWKPLLSSIEPVLKKYPNVVLVYTLRTGERPRRNNRELPASENSRETFAQQSLPDNVWKLESHGFNDKLTLEAIRAYFRNYQIIADPLVAPISFFSHPLNLKIFCEVTNRSADKPVKVAEFPSSIYSLFGAQMEHSAQKISEMVNLKTKYRIEDVNRALYFLGELLWTGRGRCVSESSFTELVAISNTSWDDNIINLLAQEGVLFRNPSTDAYSGPS